MGDRAVISNKNKKLGIYLHWYGYREFVESLLAYCDAKNYRSPDVDDEYGWARLCQVAGNTVGGGLSVGVGVFKDMDADNWDNGTYIIEGWDIKERMYQQYDDEKMRDSMYENLKYINDKQPNKEQLTDEELITFAKYWEVRHLDRLNDERRKIVEEIIKEEQAKEKAEQNKRDEIDSKNLTIEDTVKIKKALDDFKNDVQKPVGNNIKEDNGVNNIEEKGDDEIARE